MAFLPPGVAAPVELVSVSTRKVRRALERPDDPQLQVIPPFPGIHFNVLWTVVEHDRAVAVVDMRGTHEGSWLMVRTPTHRPMRASLMLAFEFDHDGMIVDNWLGTNFIAMLAQLGWGVAPIGETVPRPEA